MRIDPSGWPFVLGALALSLVAAFAVSVPLGAGLLALSAFFLFFFRDPDRPTPVVAGAILAPADGRVIVAGTSTSQDFPPGNWQQISIFLSPMDVHVNRMPAEGRVVKVRYHPGRFLPAYKAEAGDLNEYTEVWLQHGSHMIVVRQVVGILARRIVCRVKEGSVVKPGERFGVMKFGSRMDVFMPATSDIRVKVGDKAVGGVTVIALLT